MRRLGSPTFRPWVHICQFSCTICCSNLLLLGAFCGQFWAWDASKSSSPFPCYSCRLSRLCKIYPFRYDTQVYVIEIGLTSSRSLAAGPPGTSTAACVMSLVQQPTANVPRKPRTFSIRSALCRDTSVLSFDSWIRTTQYSINRSMSIMQLVTRHMSV